MSFKGRPTRWAGFICVVLLLVYAASPYFSFWRFTNALRSGDAAAVAARVDFPAVRESLKKQLITRFSATASGHNQLRKFGPSVIDALVEAYVTPEGLALILANPDLIREPRRPEKLSGASERVDWSKARHAFFIGPRTFVVDWEGIKLRFRFRPMGWRLDDLDLCLNRATG